MDKRRKASRMIGWIIGLGIKIITTIIRLAKYRLVAIIECHRCGLRHNKYPIKWNHLFDWKNVNRFWVFLALMDGWICDGHWNYCPRCSKIILDYMYKTREEEKKKQQKLKL